MIITEFPDGAAAGTVHVKGGKVCCIDNHEPERDSHVIEKDGALFVPAFIDAHVHLFDLGFALLDPDITASDSFENAVETVKNHPAYKDLFTGTRPGILALNRNESRLPAIIARGFDETIWGSAPPDRNMLDSAFPDVPVVFIRRDYHSFVANSPGLIWLNMASTTSHESLESSIFTHPLDRLPGLDLSTGMIRGEAANEAWRVMSLYRSEADFDAAIQVASSFLICRGVGRVHALFGSADDNEECKRLMERLKRAGETDENGDIIFLDTATGHKLYITPYMQTSIPAIAESYGLKFCGGCVMLDGSLGSRTAALLEPYSDDPESTGILYMSDEEVETLISAAVKLDMQTAFHAIGDKAIKQLLKAYQKSGGGISHRIEHMEMIDEEGIEQMKRLKLIPSVQPAFEALWGNSGGMYQQRVGDRTESMNPFADMIKTGLKPAGGSDAPITPAAPLFGIRGALNHPVTSQRISFNQAMAMFTRWAAEATPHKSGGTITPGDPALISMLYPFDFDANNIKEDTEASRV